MTPNWLPLQTPRLTLRRLKASDDEAAFAILSCEETCGGRVFHKSTRDASDIWLHNRLEEQAAGQYSMWAVMNRQQKVVGFCGFVSQPPKPEICYIIRKMDQRCGFATEIMSHLLARVLDDKHQVVAVINRNNSASIKLAQKIGMQAVPSPHRTCIEFQTFGP